MPAPHDPVEIVRSFAESLEYGIIARTEVDSVLPFDVTVDDLAAALRALLDRVDPPK